MIHSLRLSQRRINLDDGREFLSWQPDGWVGGERLHRCQQRGSGLDLVTVQFINDPQDAVHFHLGLAGSGSQFIVAGEKDAAGMILGEREGEPVMHRELGKPAYMRLRTQHCFTRKINHFEAASDQISLLRRGEPDKFLFKQCVRDEKVVGQSQ